MKLRKTGVIERRHFYGCDGIIEVFDADGGSGGKTEYNCPIDDVEFILICVKYIYNVYGLKNVRKLKIRRQGKHNILITFLYLNKDAI